MKLNESGFTFGGKHSRRDMGVWYIEKDTHPVSADITRNEYTIAGASESVLYPGETMKAMSFSGTLVLVTEPATQAEAQEKIRRIMAWLGGGRKKLIFDYEPGKYYLAQVDKAATWSLKNWFGGELSVTFTAQPYAYAVSAQTGETTLAGASGSVSIAVDTFYPAPLVLVIQNTGAAPITGVQILGGKVSLSGMNLPSGSQMTISMETPISAQDGTGANLLPYATSFSVVRFSKGTQTIPISLTYGEGTPGAKVFASVRGRW